MGSPEAGGFDCVFGLSSLHASIETIAASTQTLTAETHDARIGRTFTAFASRVKDLGYATTPCGYS
jgi:hypothetical protein